ncbi:DNA topoisomerase 1 [Cocos nucifera]|uniref:DNA topoisomerase n=1 Tax=Cocos nucifera TaxID=13894 RepID=A0A8K0HWG3_COCNU|nr:DNA topoisomerase 1 [Cocos nucifera]
MALQFRRLVLSSFLRRNFCSFSRFSPAMLQYRAVQNFPCSCLPHSSLGYGGRYVKPAYGRRYVNNYLLNLEDAKVTITQCPQFKFRTLCSARHGGNQTSGSFEVSGSSRLNSLAHELISRRLFSSRSKRVKSKKGGGNVVMEDNKSGDGSSAVKVLRGSKKQEKSSAACNNNNGEINAAVASPSRKGAAKNSKAANRVADAAKNEEQAIQNVKAKKGTAKRNGKTQTAKTAVRKNQKRNSKKQDAELSASIAAAAEPKGVRKTSEARKAGATSALHEAKNSRENSPVGRAENGRRQLRPLYPPCGKSVVVVESVTKAKVIQNYLGDMFEVLPSYGHVRDLAGRSRSVRPDDDFSMVWEVPAAAWTHLKSIKVALSGAENLVLASDPDREGEAIAWHITEMLQQQDALNDNVTVARVVFHEITESSIKNALQAPREIDVNLVNAYLARRALDYLIGFSISPLLWRKLPGCQSAGRVQSAALALICDRETEIEQFDEQEYWTVGAEFQYASSESLKNSVTSQLTHFDSKKLDQLSIHCQAEAEAIERWISSSKFQVIGVKTSEVQRNPPMPYITSTLQQDAANKLNFTASYTMKVAQKLYEGIKLSDEEATGLITYMRTDGLHVSNEAAEDIHSLVKERYAEEFASKNIRKYFRKVKNAQEAHEAIRPTNIRRLPSTLVGILDDDSLKLYALIWTRTMACQMEPATTDMIQVDIGNSERNMIFRSVGSRVGFPGYQAVYEDKEARVNGNDDKEENVHKAVFEVLHKLKVKDLLSLVKVHSRQHYTKPPPRYSEASLVKKLEELGIGRPSTYASIMKVLQDRNYVTRKNRVLHPEFRGRMVSAFLCHHFSEVADYSFTADMENELDNVSAGLTEWKGLLRDYWSRFSKYCDLASNFSIRQVEKMLEETFGHILFASLPNNCRVCPSCSEGTLTFKVSRFGAGYFIGCDQHPKCKYIASTLFREDDDAVDPDKPEKSFPPKLLGYSPESNERIYLKNGPYGYYIQLGDDRKGYSPKRASISEVKDVVSITLEDAIELLQYPITLGNHPEDEYPVLLTHSKFGFSIRHRRTVAPVPKSLSPKKITLEAGLKLLSSKKAKQFGRPKGKPKPEEALWE